MLGSLPPATDKEIIEGLKVHINSLNRQIESLKQEVLNRNNFILQLIKQIKDYEQ